MTDKIARAGIHGIGYFVRWNAYGEWKQTSAIWANRPDAEKHAEYLKREEHNKHVRVRETPLPLHDN